MLATGLGERPEYSVPTISGLAYSSFLTKVTLQPDLKLMHIKLPLLTALVPDYFRTAAIVKRRFPMNH